MSRNGLLQVVEGRALLQAERLHDGQDALDESTTARAGTTKGAATPQHGAAQHPLGVVVGRLHVSAIDEQPQGRINLQNTAAKSRRPPIPTTPRSEERR